VFAFLVSGWDDDPQRPGPGGVAWVESPTNSDRNTVSTAPAAQLGFMLHGLGAGAGGALEWAERMLAWVHDTLCDPADGLYWDHIDAAGTIERTKWSYNQGNVIGAELARIMAAAGSDTVPGSDASRAAALAVAALDHYETAPGGLAAQGLPFNAVFLRNLLDLGAALGGPLASRVREVAVGVADEAWRTRRGAGDLVRPDRRGSAVALVDQAGMVEIQALAARAAGDGLGAAGAGDLPPSSPGGGTG
jgi:predicted alpha-1,6-mannanase (GH76 family)